MLNEIAKCGCNCFNCPTFKDNIRTFEERVQCSMGWKKYLNINLGPEKLRACDGCSLHDSQRKTYYLNCKVRKCAMINDISNCAYCIDFPCKELLEVHSLQNIKSREDFIRIKGRQISEKDYQKIIEPYTGLNHLQEIRKDLTEKDYKNTRKFSISPKFTPIEKIEEKSNNIKAIYSILTNLAVADNVSYAAYLTLINKRKKLLLIIWAIAGDGIINHKDEYLELDAKSFLANKIPSTYSVLKDYFLDLKIHDINCDLIPLDEKKWITPGGGLRKEGWVVRLSFGASLSGWKTLLQFKDYISRLKTNYGKTAFRLFSRADLHVLNQ